MEIKYFQTTANKLPGTSYSEVFKHAHQTFEIIRKRTKRQPYVRSAFFKKDKIFFNIFWKHMFEKSFKVRTERLKYFSAAVALIRQSRVNPYSKENSANREEILHRFYGKTKAGQKFIVQIKENKRTKAKHLMSMFPE